MTTISLYYRAIHKRVSLASLPAINWKLMYWTGILLLLPLLVFYIYLVNQLTAGAYLIRNYDKQLTNSSEENKKLEATFAESGFLGIAIEKAKAMDFQKT